MIETIHRFVLPAAYSLLPPKMESPHATAMLLAIGLQESRFRHRAQIGGPARGFWQFEMGGGVTGVLMRHPGVRPHAQRALIELRYADSLDSPEKVHAVLAHNDILAAVFARLLLWTVPGKLPLPTQGAAAWRQYIDGWRPGKPHPNTWHGFYTEAWQRVEGTHT